MKGIVIEYATAPSALPKAGWKYFPLASWHHGGWHFPVAVVLGGWRPLAAQRGGKSPSPLLSKRPASSTLSVQSVTRWRAAFMPLISEQREGEHTAQA